MPECVQVSSFCLNLVCNFLNPTNGSMRADPEFNLIYGRYPKKACLVYNIKWARKMSTYKNQQRQLFYQDYKRTIILIHFVDKAKLDPVYYAYHASHIISCVWTWLKLRVNMCEFSSFTMWDILVMSIKFFFRGRIWYIKPIKILSVCFDCKPWLTQQSDRITI